MKGICKSEVHETDHLVLFIILKLEPGLKKIYSGPMEINAKGRRNKISTTL